MTNGSGDMVGATSDKLKIFVPLAISPQTHHSQISAALRSQ